MPGAALERLRRAAPVRGTIPSQTREEMTTMAVTLDEVFNEGDAVVERVDGTHTFVAANKVGREALLRAIEKVHGKGCVIGWRDAGEGWPDTWLGCSFVGIQDRPAAAAMAAQGARVFHRSESGEVT